MNDKEIRQYAARMIAAYGLDVLEEVYRQQRVAHKVGASDLLARWDAIEEEVRTQAGIPSEPYGC